MADNTTLSVAVGAGDSVRDRDRAGVKTQIVGLDLTIGGASETLMNGTMPCSQSGAWSVTLAAALPAGSATVGGVNLAQYTPASGRLPVDGSGVTQPVSDGGGSLTVDGTVGVTGPVTVTGTFWQATQPVSAAALPLPAGAATSARQDTGNTSLASLDAKAPALGQALATASLPVVLTAAQLSTLTPLNTVAVTGTFWQATQPVSGTVTANAGSGPWPVTDNGGSLTVDAPAGTPVFVRLSDGTAPLAALPVTDNGGSLTVDGTIGATQSGAWTVATNADAPVGAGTAPAKALAVAGVYNTSTPAPTDGQTVGLQLDAGGSLKVAITGGAGSGGTSAADGSAYTAGLTGGTPLMGVRDDTATGALAEDKVGLIRATTQRALHVNLRDAAGTELSVGGGTQYTEDAVAVANPTGNALIVVRDDSRAGSLVSANGDNVALRGTNSGELYVKHVDSVAVTGTFWQATQPVSGTFWQATQPVSGTVAATQSGTWNVGTLTSITNVVHVDDNAGSLTVDGTVAVSGTVAVDTELTTADLDTGAGTDTRAVVGLAYGAAGGGLLVSTTNPLPVGDNGGSLTVDGAVTANAGTNLNTSALALEAGGNLAAVAGAVRAEDAASADGHTGIGLLAVRKATPANTSGTDGDYEFLQMSAGRLWASATIDAALPAGSNVIGAVTQSGTWNVGTVTTVTTVSTLTSLSQWAGNAIDTNSGVKSAGTLRVVLATDQPALTNAQPANLTQVGGAAVAAGHGTAAGALRVELPTDGTGVVGLNAGTAVVGKVGIDQTTAGTTNAVTPVPAASGGPTASRVKAAASTNATNLKASAGQVYGWALFNNTSSAKFLKFYNKASSPTVGTDTPLFTVIIPASGGTNIHFGMGVPFGTGIAYAITGAVADSDTTSTASDDVHGTILWR